MHRLAPSLVLLLAACAAPPPPADGDLGRTESLLSAAERRVRAGEIRDAAAANGITQGWLLAGIADAETRMSHCWSELTWACMGPPSADCGGGPVVAGAGDGPCHLREGGLGMFQFDAGTFDDTLAREGDRVLSIAGNVAAAVDFVIAMVIRSSYVDGVSTDAEAVEWINGVRIGNERWDPWVRTVVRYYNGCRETSGCWTQRYGHYRDNTTGVYEEMGADFWGETGPLPDTYGAAFVEQSFPLASQPFEVYPGQEIEGFLELRNTGTAAWMPGVTMLGTSEPRDMDSPIAASDWPSTHRAATVDRVVLPGETGRFTFHVRGPEALGEYSQFFNVVQEGVTWFSDSAGPPDGQIEVRVQVVDSPACPGGATEEWACSGDERVRCEFGEVVTEVCSDGCDGSGAQAICAGTPPDLPDPTDPSGPGRDSVGGCAVQPHGHGPAWMLGLLGLAVLGLRRRR